MSEKRKGKEGGEKVGRKESASTSAPKGYLKKRGKKNSLKEL